MEAKAWLVSAVAGLQGLRLDVRSAAFAALLPRPGQPLQPVHSALVAFLLEESPRAVASMVAQYAPALLRAFFQSDPQARAPPWFDHFSMAGLPAFKHGAKALALYAMEHR